MNMNSSTNHAASPVDTTSHNHQHQHHQQHQQHQQHQHQQHELISLLKKQRQFRNAQVGIVATGT
jgi:hypothetical protein